MEPADLRDGHHRPERGRLHLAWPWTVVAERLMWARGVVVGDVTAQDSVEMSLIQDEDVVEAFSAD
jgi:hypothetical protein